MSSPLKLQTPIQLPMCCLTPKGWEDKQLPFSCGMAAAEWEPDRKQVWFFGESGALRPGDDRRQECPRFLCGCQKRITSGACVKAEMVAVALRK